MLFERFLLYSLRLNKPVRVLLYDEKLRYMNLTVISMSEEGILALKSSGKKPVPISYNQILAVSYVRGDSGDTSKELFNVNRKYFNKEERFMKKIISVKGIMCGHCEMRVKKALEALLFIDSAEVSHETGKAVVSVSGDFDENAVKSAIAAAGYEFVSIE